MNLKLEKSSSIQALEKKYCDHCGDPCDQEEIIWEDHTFCCQGCKTVFQILNDHDLGVYYQIENQPGSSLKSGNQLNYEFLDDAEMKVALISFSEGSKTKVTFYFPQIHCSSCIWLLEHLYKLKPGILQANVNFLAKECTFLYDEDLISLRTLVELLASIGYAPDIKLAHLESPKPAVDRSLYYKLGIAGFCFGNIMLLSFPEYLGLDGSEGFRPWFGYLNLVLALPVFFYCARDYFLSAWLGLRQRRLNMDVPIAFGILTLFLRSAFEILTTSGAGYMDSLAGLVFFLLIGKWFQQTTYYHLQFERNYKSYFPISVTSWRNNSWRSIPLDKVEINDRLLIRNEELIPVDGLVTQGNGRIDYSFVTGESDPISKEVGEQIYAGGKQVGQQIEMVVTKKVEQSYLTQLWNESAFQKEDANQSVRLADQTGKYFTIIILMIACGTLIFWLLNNPALAINAFTAVLIIACPCAISLAIPFTYGNAIRILAQQQFFLKHIHVIEAIQAVNYLIFDKTGTLTMAQNQQIEYHGTGLSDLEKQWVKTLVLQSSHPLSQSIASTLEDYPKLDIQHFEEIKGKGLQGNINGQSLKIGSASFLGLPPTEKTSVYIQIAGIVKGQFEFDLALRNGLPAMIEQLDDDGLSMGLLSGDNEKDKARIGNLFANPEAVRFNQSPFDKLKYIKTLQSRNQKVMMIGDGLNDAGALKQSDVGIVVTENLNNFTPASDAILAASKFIQLPQFIKYTKLNRQIIWVTYLFAFVYNVIGLSFAVQGTLSPVIAAILMPLSSVSVVLVGVSLSTLAAQVILRNKKKD